MKEVQVDTKGVSNKRGQRDNLFGTEQLMSWLHSILPKARSFSKRTRLLEGDQATQRLPWHSLDLEQAQFLKLWVCNLSQWATLMYSEHPMALSWIRLITLLVPGHILRVA